MTTTLWEKYINKKEQDFYNSEEYKAIKEALDFLYPEKWEIEVERTELPKFYQIDRNTHWYLDTYGNERGARYLMDRGKKFSEVAKVNVNCTIHFPEIQISNSNVFKHKRRDLYVRLKLSLNNPLEFVQLEGFRATLGQREYIKGYAHSHLPGGSFYEWQKFCKGNSEFGCSQSGEFINKDKNIIFGFLFLMESYLQHESIEGVPYIRMEVCQNAGTLNSISISHYDLMEFVRRKPPLKIDKNLKVKNFEEIEEWLYKNYTRYRAIKIGNNYYSENNNSIVNNLQQDQGKVITKFKNQEIKLKIDNYDTGKTAKSVSHPKFTESIIKYWESRIKKTYITKYRTINKNTCKNTSEGDKSSKVFVSENMGS